MQWQTLPILYYWRRRIKHQYDAAYRGLNKAGVTGGRGGSKLQNLFL